MMPERTRLSFRAFPEAFRAHSEGSREYDPSASVAR